MANRRGPVALQMAAAAGNILAQYELGELYRSGPYDEPNYKEAVKWHWEAARQGHLASKLVLIEILFRQYIDDKYAIDVRAWGHQLAEQGNVRAQYIMAFSDENDPLNMYYSEHYLHMMKKAADQGCPQALFLLGTYFEFVDGLERSLEKAFMFYMQSADLGFSPAMESLGVLYAEGRGTARNDEKAIELLKQAISSGRIREASLALGKVYERKDTPQDYQEAISCYQRAFEAHSDLASYHLGQIYEFGRGVPRDYSEAAKWYLRGCERSFDIARNNMQAFYLLRDSICIKLGLDHPAGCQASAEEGNAVAQAEFGMYSIMISPNDKEKKAAWLFRLAAEQGNSIGQFCLGCMIEFRSGIESDPDALSWFNRAALQGLKEGQAAMGRACAKQFDYNGAAIWYMKATEQDDLGAKIALGQLYFDGKGVKEDQSRAVEIFRSVAKRVYTKHGALMRNLHANGPGQFRHNEREWHVRM